jgi:hypothetical protein
MYYGNSAPISIISRPKRSLLGKHVGVQLLDGSVVDLTPDGPRHVSYAVFAEGKRCTVVRAADPSRYHHIMWRISAALANPRPYHLTEYNCEAFANEMLGDPPKSDQVQGVAVFGLLLLAIKAFS